MKVALTYLACFFIALTLSIPTVTVMKALNEKSDTEIVVTEEPRQIIYAPQPIIKYAENKHTIRNPHKIIVEDVEQIFEIIEFDEPEEEYLAAPEQEIEFKPFETFVYNGTRYKFRASENLQRIVYETAKRYELPYRVVLALLGAETGWNENPNFTVTHNGAKYIGIGCINEEYHAERLARKGINIYTLDGNIEGVCYILEANYERFGTIELALMGYNGGAGHVQWAIERGISENGYTRTVMRYAESFE